ncbi:MAG: YcxB family protein [Cyanobacteria bacterium P01_C01_bin.118]
MNNTVAVIFTYKREEYMQAIRRHYLLTLKLRRDIIVGVLGICLGIYLAFIVKVGWIGWLVIVVGMLLLAIIAYAIFLLPLLIYQSQPKLKDEYKLVFSEGGIDFKTSQIDSTLQWSLYYSWRLDSDFYILYYGKRELTVIPRRVMDTSADRQLQELLLAQLGRPKSQ